MLNIIACDPIVGLPRVPLPGGLRPDVADLLAEMDRLGISRSVVRHRAALDGGPEAAWYVSREDLAGNDRLIPALPLTPDGREPDWDVSLALGQALREGARLAWADPVTWGFSLQPWCCGPLYRVLTERRVPLLVEYGKTSANELEVILSAFPDLRLILLGAPREGRNRLLYPLLERHPNLWLCLSNLYSVHRGFEDLVRNFGPDRWVFGTNYPVSEGGAALAGLMYADLTPAARGALAAGNLERLLGEVVL